MTNLRFKEYVFRHNPRKLNVFYRSKTSSAVCFGFGEAIQQLGKGVIVVEGEGELFGPDVMEQFYRLRKVANEGGSGILSGAGLEPMKAVFENLEMVGRGGETILSYRFRFVEERRAE